MAGPASALHNPTSPWLPPAAYKSKQPSKTRTTIDFFPKRIVSLDLCINFFSIFSYGATAGKAASPSANNFWVASYPSVNHLSRLFSTI